jgi:predicted nucleic acid-binding protein
VILPDSSAWVDFFRGPTDGVGTTLRSLVDLRATIVTSGQVVMEVLVGARSDRDLTKMRSVLTSFPILPTRKLEDFESAVGIYRTCRQAGETIRTLSDCLIAAQALRAGAFVLHHDRDFDVISRHTDLRIHVVGA